MSTCMSRLYQVPYAHSAEEKEEYRAVRVLALLTDQLDSILLFLFVACRFVSFNCSLLLNIAHL